MRTFPILFTPKLNSRIGKRHAWYINHFTHHTMPKFLPRDQHKYLQHLISSEMLKKKMPCTQVYANILFVQTWTTAKACKHGCRHLDNVYSNNPLHVLSIVRLQRRIQCDVQRCAKHASRTPTIISLLPSKMAGGDICIDCALHFPQLNDSWTSSQDLERQKKKSRGNGKSWLTPGNSYHSATFPTL